MSNRLLSISCLAAMAALGLSCKQTTRIRNDDHCVFNGGDAYCAAEYPDTPLCNAGQGMCAIGDPIGCVAEVSPECHAPCGDPEDRSCIDGSSSGTDSGSGTEGSSGETAGTEGSSSSDGGMATTTGDMPCMGDEDCTDAAAPFCNPAGECVDCGELADGNAACADADPGRPVCDAGVCVACTEQDPGACGGQTPVCGEDNLCQACTEHSECPGTACHLDGPMVGACFGTAAVPVANVTALNNAIAGLGAGGQAVFELQPGTYGATINVGGDLEIAILGDGSPILAGNGSRAVDAFSNSIVYLSGVQVVNGSGDGLNCSGTSVWLDDSEVRNNAQVGMDISGGCAAHLRRSMVRVNVGGGISVGGGDLELANSVVALNGNGVSIFGGLALNTANVLVTYSTIAGNDSANAAMSVQCSNTVSGEVRNSIIVGADAGSVGTCSPLGFATNAMDLAVPLAGGNVNVGAFVNGWFTSAAMGDFRLSGTGQGVIPEVASWQEGDPLADFEGTPIPMGMPSFPGYDQP